MGSQCFSDDLTTFVFPFHLWEVHLSCCFEAIDFLNMGPGFDFQLGQSGSFLCEVEFACSLHISGLHMV